MRAPGGRRTFPGSSDTEASNPPGAWQPHLQGTDHLGVWVGPVYSVTGVHSPFRREGRLDAGRDGGQPGSCELLPPQTVPPGLREPCPGQVPCWPHIGLLGGPERTPEPADCLLLPRPRPGPHPQGLLTAHCPAWHGVSSRPCFWRLRPPIRPMAPPVAHNSSLLQTLTASPCITRMAQEWSLKSPRLDPSAGRANGLQSPEEPGASPR